jgi:integral membrane protein
MSRLLRVAAVVEAGTYLVLLAAVVHRRVGGGADLVPATGLLHGLVFLGYAGTVLANRRPRGWGREEVVRLLFAAFVPVGTVVVERRLRPPVEVLGDRATGSAVST